MEKKEKNMVDTETTKSMTDKVVKAREEIKKRTFLFIDGTNLYAGQYELFGPRKYLYFPKFIQEVEDKIGVKFDKIYFYASYSPQPKKLSQKDKNYLKNEALFYRSVQKMKNVIFFKGYRLKSSGKEKEVDVKLGVDIVHFAHLGLYDRLYFISEDADFAHALLIVKKLRKKVYVLALENRIPLVSCIYSKLLSFRLVEKAVLGVYLNKKCQLLNWLKAILDRYKKIPEMRASRAS